MKAKININSLNHSHGRMYAIDANINGSEYYGFVINVNGTYYIKSLTSLISRGKRQAKTSFKMEIEQILNNN